MAPPKHLGTTSQGCGPRPASSLPSPCSRPLESGSQLFSACLSPTSRPNLAPTKRPVASDFSPTPQVTSRGHRAQWFLAQALVPVWSPLCLLAVSSFQFFLFLTPSLRGRMETRWPPTRHCHSDCETSSPSLRPSLIL